MAIVFAVPRDFCLSDGFICIPCTPRVQPYVSTLAVHEGYKVCIDSFVLDERQKLRGTVVKTIAIHAHVIPIS